MSTKLPGPKSLLGVNTLLRFRKNPMRYLQDLASKYPDIAGFRMGPVNAVLINHPDLVREVLVDQIDKFPKHGVQAKTIRLMDGNNLFVKNGSEWLKERRLVQSALHPSHLPGYAEDVLFQTRRRIDSWAETQSIDFCDETMDLSILISGMAMLGADLHSSVDRLRQTAYDRSDVFVKEMASPVRIPDHWPLKHKRQKKRVIETMDEVLLEAIQSKRKSPDDHHDPLSILINSQMESGLSDGQIRDLANIMFLAGVDDMATVMVWMFYLIAKHPQIQKQLRTEILQTVSNEPVRMKHLEGLKFVEQVVNESLRLYPATWIFTARKAIEDVTIGDHKIKHRSWVFISPYVTQRDERFFESPTKFDPDRFSPERFGKIQKCAFFPFGMGPRACAGGRFSVMQLVLVAATVLQQFELSLEPGQENIAAVPKVTVRPEGQVRIKVQRRKAISKVA